MSSGNGDHQPTRIVRPDGLGRPGGADGPDTSLDRVSTRADGAAAAGGAGAPADPAPRPIAQPQASSGDGGGAPPQTPRPIGAPIAEPAPVASSTGASAPPLDLGGAPVTVPHRPGGAAAAADAPQVKTPDAAATARPEEGSVTAWLVVVEGPGRGRAVELYYGRNIIGRSAEERITLDFGDQQISRRKAAIIIYDHMKHAFHLADGESSNAIFVNDEVLVASRQLADGDVITLGVTKLLFRPLCTPDFNWEDAPAASAEPASEDPDAV